MVNVIEIQSGF